MSNKEINAGQVRLIDLLSGRSKPGATALIVPHFQRDYVWPIRRVRECLRTVLEAQGSDIFFGNLMVQNTEGSDTPDIVIDGQQRLVTFTLTIAAVLEVVSSRQLKGTLRKCLFGDMATRVTFANEDVNRAFDSLLRGEVSTNSALGKAYKAIKDEIMESDLTDRELRDQLSKVVFVLIKVPQVYDVHTIFESLNSKNTPLRTFELVKNALFGINSQIPAKTISTSWVSLEKTFTDAGMSSSLDTFLRYRAYEMYGYLNMSEVFPRMKDVMDKITKSSPQDVHKYISELTNDAKTFVQLRSAELAPYKEMSKGSVAAFSIWQLALKDLRVTQLYAALFALCKTANRFPVMKKRSYVADDIGRIVFFGIFAKLLKIKPSNYERSIAEFVKNISCARTINEVNTARVNFFTKLSQLVAPDRRAQFAGSLQKHVCYTGVHSKRPAFFENSKYLSVLLSVAQRLPFAIGTIEHIIPKAKSWKRKWPQVADKFDESMRFSLGNLMLLERDTAGDGAFEDKTHFYKNDKLGSSYVELFESGAFYKGFASSNPASVIMKRGKKIGEAVFDVMLEALKNVSQIK